MLLNYMLVFYKYFQQYSYYLYFFTSFGICSITKPSNLVILKENIIVPTCLEAHVSLFLT